MEVRHMSIKKVEFWSEGDSLTETAPSSNTYVKKSRWNLIQLSVMESMRVCDGVSLPQLSTLDKRTRQIQFVASATIE